MPNMFPSNSPHHSKNGLFYSFFSTRLADLGFAIGYAEARVPAKRVGKGE